MSEMSLNGVIEHMVRDLGDPLVKGRQWRLFEFKDFLLASAGGTYRRFMPNYNGRILGIFGIVDGVTTDTNADGTMTVSINGVSVTGGVVTFADTADGTNPFTPVNRFFIGTRVTANDTFDANDTLALVWATTNAFDDGRARILVLAEINTP